MEETIKAVKNVIGNLESVIDYLESGWDEELTSAIELINISAYRLDDVKWQIKGELEHRNG